MANDSRFRLQNDSKRIGEALWTWSVWIEGPDDELDQIRSVRYTLHPTFPNPVRLVTDRATKFRMESSGWGEFTISARLVLLTGDVVRLERWIVLAGSSETEESIHPRFPRVFVSASAMDQDFTQILSAELKKQEVEVISADQVTGGASIADSLQSSLADADVVVIVVSGPLRSFAEHELQMAQQREKVIVPILLGQGTELPAQLKGVESLKALTSAQAGSIADALAARAKNVFYQE
jgi:hypothetical protein